MFLELFSRFLKMFPLYVFDQVRLLTWPTEKIARSGISPILNPGIRIVLEALRNPGDNGSGLRKERWLKVWGNNPRKRKLQQPFFCLSFTVATPETPTLASIHVHQVVVLAQGLSLRLQSQTLHKNQLTSSLRCYTLEVSVVYCTIFLRFGTWPF